MKKNKKSLNAISKGFTLIELMIVIVIIGILSGVLISVLKPAAAQNKARDANTKATINKLALGTGAFISATGRIPSEVEFIPEFNNVTKNGATCDTADTAACLFSVTNNDLPSTGTAGCAANGWYGSAANQCYYYYCGGDDGGATDRPSSCTWTTSTTDYKIMAKSYGTANLFMYRSADSKMYLCSATGTSCSAAY